MSIVRLRKCHISEQLRFAFCFSFWVTCRHDLGVVPMIFARHPTETIFPRSYPTYVFYLDKLFQSLNLFQIVLFEETLGEGII